MSDRRGFALLAALWLLVALATLAAGTLAAARLGSETSANRIGLRRAARAADACVAILLAHYDSTAPAAGVDTVDLGRTTWCRVTLQDPSARLNLNHASKDQLVRLLGDPALADAVLDWRDADHVARAEGAERDTYAALHRAAPRNGPFADVLELRQVRGLERFPEEWLEARFTVEGDGAVNVSAAHRDVLDALGIFGEADLDLILAARNSARRLTSLDDLLARIGASRRDELTPRYGELASTLKFAPRELVALIEGGVGPSALRAHIRLRVVPLPSRLAVVQREVW